MQDTSQIFTPEPSEQEQGTRSRVLRTSMFGFLCLGLIFGLLYFLQHSGMELTENFSHLSLSHLHEVLGYSETSPLLFNTGLFLLLFTVFIGLYQLAGRQSNLRAFLVICFSLYFYWKSSAFCCFILLGVCIADFVVGTLLYYARTKAKRRMWVWVNVLMNVGMLVYFKYLNLLWGTLMSMTGSSFDPFDIILPAGISFFCFRSISYIVDIYRGKIEPCDNLRDYIFFLTFFPPLLAGPVVRATDLMPQIKQRPVADRAMVSEGLFMIMCGLVKKVIVADYLSGNFVDRIFDNPSLYSGFENLMGVLGFSIQIYCDFSGYSDMAIGLALLMGYRFLDNFNAPFKSTNPSDFWRRWHISLSSWLRDYVYIPLGGNRKGKLRQYFNLVVTMLVGGIWHGANWMNLWWGLYNGVLISGHKVISKVWRTPARIKGTRIATVANIAVTFILIIVGMGIFRSLSFANFGVTCRQIFTDFRPQAIPSFVTSYLTITLLIVGAFAMHFLPRRLTNRVRDMFAARSLFVQSLILALVIFIVIQSRQSELVPFVYLQY